MVGETQVLVAGAGPTGLMLALELARRGIAVRIVDKLAAPSPYSRALVVHARSLELLQNLDLDQAFLARGFRTIGVAGYVEGRYMAEFELGDIGASSTPFPFVLFISQADTEHILAEALQRHGVSVERAVSLTAFRQDPAGVSATLMHADGTQEDLRCAYLAGCDGAHSVVRHGLGLAFEGAAYEQDFALADVRLDWRLPRDKLMFFLGRPGVMAVFPMREGVHRIIVTVPSGFSDPNATLALAEMQALTQRFCATDVKLSEPVWLSRFHLHHRGIERYNVGHVFLAGDAAHIHSPAGGQGMNTGIQDAANLAWKLALVLRGQATPRLLDSYSAERQPIGRVLLKRTDRLFMAAATNNRFVIALRNFLVPRFFPLIPRYPWLRRRMFRFISQLGIHYRGSAMVVELGKWRTGPCAGERAPDITLHRGDEALTLFEAMRAPEHHLLVFTGMQGEVPAERTELWQKHADTLPFPCQTIVIGGAGAKGDVLRDTGEAHELYGADESGAIYLMRPDGYVGARARLANAPAMFARYVHAL